MKRIAMMGLCFFVLTTARGFAQASGASGSLESVIVGEFNPTLDQFDVEQFDGNAQQFSLASSVYINRIDLALAVFDSLGATCAFRVAVTDKLFGDGTLGTLFLDLTETTSPPGVRQIYTFSDTFNPVLLPAGNYYLYVNSFSVPGACDGPSGTGNPRLFWITNAEFSFVVGTVGQGFLHYGGQNKWWLDALTFAFNLSGPIIVPPPTGGGLGQIARLIVEGPVVPPLGGPVQAQLGFQDITGKPIGPTSTVTLNPGQTASLDLNLSAFVRQLGERFEVRPVISSVPAAVGAPPPPSAQVSASVQLFDALSGFGTLIAPALPPGSSVPPLNFQILAGKQTMRLNVTALPFDPCAASLSFADKNGNPVGPTLPVDLSPGAGTSLDLSADALGLQLGQEAEVRPVVTVTPPLAAGQLGLPSKCSGVRSLHRSDVVVSVHFGGTSCRTVMSRAVRSRLVLPAQMVDATLCNALIRECFSDRADLFGSSS